MADDPMPRRRPLPAWAPDLDVLQLLLAVAELGSVGRAAADQGITQPSASARLSRLERRLGVPLLVRSTRGSSLTPAGEAVATWARGTLDAALALTDGVAALRAERRDRLRVAASLTVAEYLLPLWLLAVRRRHGHELDIAAEVANSAEVCARVTDGSVDVGFVESAHLPAGLTRRPVGTDRLAVVVAPGHPLAGRGAHALSGAELALQPLLLREPGSGTREVLLDALGLTGPPPGATSLGSTATVLAAARAGGGVAVVSERAVRADLAGGTLVELPTAGLALTRTLHAVWLGRFPGEAARELIELAAADA